MIKPYYVPLMLIRKRGLQARTARCEASRSCSTRRPPAIWIDTKASSRRDGFASPPRDVKARFEPLATRETDEALLKLANAEPPAPGGGGGRNFTPEQRAEREFLNKKWEMIYAEGPALVLEPSRGDGGTIFVQGATLAFPAGTADDKRKTVRDKDAPPVIPQVVVAVEQYNRILRMMASSAPVELEINVSAKYHPPDLMSHNVVAEIPGTD